jgi:hypothetical protein
MFHSPCINQIQKYINNQQNAFNILWCILLTLVSPACFGQYSGHLHLQILVEGPVGHTYTEALMYRMLYIPYVYTGCAWWAKGKCWFYLAGDPPHTNLVISQITAWKRNMAAPIECPWVFHLVCYWSKQHSSMSLVLIGCCFPQPSPSPKSLRVMFLLQEYNCG